MPFRFLMSVGLNRQPNAYIPRFINIYTWFFLRRMRSIVRTVQVGGIKASSALLNVLIHNDTPRQPHLMGVVQKKRGKRPPAHSKKPRNTSARHHHNLSNRDSCALGETRIT